MKNSISLAGSPVISDEKRAEIKALFSRVNVSEICIRLGIPRYRIYYALNTESRSKKAYEDLSAVVHAAKEETATLDAIIQTL